MLQACRSRIEALTTQLPNVSNLLDGFQITAELEQQLLALPFAEDPPKLNRIYQKSPDQFLFGLACDYRWDSSSQTLRNLADEEISHEKLYSIAMVWVLLAIRNWYHSSLPVHFFAAFDEWYSTGQPSSIPRYMLAAEFHQKLHWSSDSVQDWIKSLAAVESEHDSVVEKHLRKVNQLLKTIHTFQPMDAVKDALIYGSMPSIPLGIQKLSERDSLTCAWYFPRPAEQKTIKSFFLRGLRSDAGKNGEFYEDALLAMSIWMGRDVENILDLKCIGYLEEIPFKEDSLRCQYLVHQTSTTWHVPRAKTADTTFDSITPHKALSLRIQKIVPWHGRARLIDMLPPTPVPWAQRCYERMSIELKCSPTRARLMARDYMVRLMYEGTANSALVEFWRGCAGSAENGARTVALKHYIKPFSGPVSDTYRSACKQIFGSLEAATVTTSGNPKTPLPPVLIDLKFLDRAVEQLQKLISTQQDPADAHNAVAVLTLLLLVVATGHRRSRTPFFFPWDIDLDDEIVFVSDKLVVGSEARFLPLPSVVCRQVQGYVHHLSRLTRSTRVTKDIRNHALWICSFFEDPKKGMSAFSPDPLLNLGFLFQIDATSTASTLKTGDVEAELRKLGIAFETRASRRQIAQYFMDSSHGGKCVQAFLGHQPEYHAFGPRSSWTVLEWASTLRPTQTKYLENLGLKDQLIVCQSDKPVTTKSLCLIKPPRAMSMNGYEGRNRDSMWAAQRARQAVRSVLGEINFASLSMVVDDDLVKVVHSKIEAEIPTDQAARKKISLELSKYLDRLREAGLTKVQSAIVNLQPTDVGPVDLDFARSLRIAKSFRLDWLGALGHPIGTSAWDRTERLAQLCINLVVQDAVLAPERLAALLDAISNDEGVAIYKDQICLRAQVSTRKSKFETSVSLSVSSMALVLGCQKSAVVGLVSISWKEVDARVSTILRKLLGQPVGVKVWKVASLCHFFRAYWFIQLPGFLYSIAVGVHNGPAVDETTERNLFEDRPFEGGIFSLSAPRSASSLNFQGKTPQRQAYEALTSLLRRSAGELGDGSATKRNQRGKLLVNLKTASNTELAYWREQQPIVDLLHGYLGNLLEEGGLRKANLAFSSIDSYFRAMAKGLVQLAWDKSFDAWSSDEYTALYQNLEKTLSSPDKPTGTSIRTFHRYLQDSFDAPPCPYLFSGPPVPSRIRGSLVTAQQADDAIRALMALKSMDPNRLRRAALQIALCSGYGLRRMEAIALETAAFDTTEPQFLSIEKNGLRDLKSPSSRRTIPAMLNTKKLKKLVEEVKAASSLAPVHRSFLFEEVGRELPIYPNAVESQIAYAALRWSSGNDRSLLHSLRHTYSTQVLLGAFCPMPSQPATIRAIARLCSELDPQATNALLRGPDNWPFQIDLMAKAMGHSGVDTLLDVYFHASSWMTAEYCAKQYVDSDLSDARLAGILGKDRTVITKQRLVACKPGGDDVKGPNHIFVLSRVQAAQSGLSRGLHDRQKTQIKTIDGDLSGQSEVISMIHFDRLLRHRSAQECSVDQITEYATDQIGLPSKLVKAFFDKYRKAVTGLGFDDFEFKHSELVHQAGKYRGGMLQSLDKRELFLGTISAFIAAGDEHRLEAIKALLQAWYARVDIKKPLIVCLNKVEVHSAMSLLQSLGVLPMQIKLLAYCSPSDADARSLANDFPNMTVHAIGRASRGVKNAVVREFAINVGQAKLALVPDGRDFHRCLLIAALALGCTSELS